MRRTFSSDELLPCCGCGNRRVHIEKKDCVFFALCDKCGTSGAVYPTQIQAARSWNKKNRQKGGLPMDRIGRKKEGNAYE